MNEQIRKLAQPHLAHERFNSYGESTQEDYYEFYPDELASFVQAIVDQCAEVADNADATRQKWEGIGKYVREHFGVEQ